MRPVRLFTAFVAAAVGSLVAAEQSQYAPLTAASLPKREIAACERTYGTGSIECGHANETEPMMCYNPSSGQSCCPDNGYCDGGQYCAPVAGYCCLHSENLKDCAANAGFELPAAVLAGLATNSSSASVVTAVSNAASRANVQVWAVAGKEQWTLVCMSLGIGIVGVIMATF